MFLSKYTIDNSRYKWKGKPKYITPGWYWQSLVSYLCYKSKDHIVQTDEYKDIENQRGYFIMDPDFANCYGEIRRKEEPTFLVPNCFKGRPITKITKESIQAIANGYWEESLHKFKPKLTSDEIEVNVESGFQAMKWLVYRITKDKNPTKNEG